VYDARFAKPVDLELIKALVTSGIPILTVEDHHETGGFGTCVIEACNELGLATQSIYRLGLPDEWIYQGSRGEQQRAAGIDADGIARKLIEVLEAPGRATATPIAADLARPAAALKRKLGA